MNTGLSYTEEKELEAIQLEEQHERQIVLDFREAVSTWMAWTKENFPKSGAKSSLIHLQEEIKEVLRELDMDEPHPRQDESVMTLMEYADCMICLLTAVGKSGMTIEQLLKAMMNKMQTNYKRKWKLNPDNTYSHIKE